MTTKDDEYDFLFKGECGNVKRVFYQRTHCVLIVMESGNSLEQFQGRIALKWEIHIT